MQTGIQSPSVSPMFYINWITLCCHTLLCVTLQDATRHDWFCAAYRLLIVTNKDAFYNFIKETGSIFLWCDFIFGPKLIQYNFTSNTEQAILPH